MAQNISMETILYTLGILFAMLIVYTFYTVYKDKTTTLTKFFTVIAGISAIAVSLNLIINTYVQMRDIYDRNQRVMIENSQTWTELIKICVEYYPYSHRFYNQLVSESKLLKIPSKFPPIEQKYENDPDFLQKRLDVEFYICVMCIQAMENFLIYGKYDKSGAYTWISTYLWWFYSPILVAFWEDYNLGYSLDTVEFVNSLIEVSKKMKENDPTTFDELMVFVNQVKYTYRE